MRGSVFFLSFLCLTAQLGGCKTFGSDSDVKFGVLGYAGTGSMLKVIAENEGNLDVCLGFPDSSQAQANLLADKAKALVTKAMNAWNTALRDVASWPVKHDLNPMWTIQTAECSRQLGNLAFNFWTVGDRFLEEACTGRPASACASHHKPGTSSLFLGPLNRGLPDDPFQYFAVLHEYGHAIGLADTYKMPGIHDWPGAQPPSVMNGLAVPRDVLTKDDIMGIAVTWRFVSTGEKSCKDFGANIDMTANAWSSLMCDPSAEGMNTDAGQDMLPILKSGKYSAVLSGYSGDIVVKTDAGGVASVRMSFVAHGSATDLLLTCAHATSCKTADETYRLLRTPDAGRFYFYFPEIPQGVLFRLMQEAPGDGSGLNNANDQIAQIDKIACDTAACYADVANRWDAEMNRVYDLLRSSLAAADQQILKTAQVAWIDFRDKEKVFINANFPQSSTRSAFIGELIRRRAIELSNYGNIMDPHLTGNADHDPMLESGLVGGDESVQHCLGHGGDAAECYATGRQAWDAELNSVYGLLRGPLSQALKDKLKAAQLASNAFDGKDASLLTLLHAKGGPQKPIQYYTMWLTKARAIMLGNYRDLAN